MTEIANIRANATSLVDLMAFANLLEKSSYRLSLAGAARNLFAAFSASIGIKHATDELAYFVDMVIPPGGDITESLRDKRSDIVAGAVFQAAIMSYCRATGTGSEVRLRTPLPDRLPADLKGAHYRIMSLRDHAIAHYGRADWAARTAWADEQLLLVTFDGEAKFDFASNKANWLGSAVADLSALLDAMPALTRDLIEDRAADLGAKLIEAASDPRVQEALERNLVDTSCVWKSKEVLRRWLEMPIGVSLPTSWVFDPASADLKGRDQWPRTPRKKKR